MGWPPSGTMHGCYASYGSYEAYGIRWRPMKMENTEIVIGNHRDRITRITPIARITPRFFSPMVADVNKVYAVNLVLLAPSMVL